MTKTHLRLAMNDQERPKGQKRYLKCESCEIITEKKENSLPGRIQDHLRIIGGSPRTIPGPRQDHPRIPPENHPRERGSAGRGTTIRIEGQGATGGNTTNSTPPYFLHASARGGPQVPRKIHFWSEAEVSWFAVVPGGPWWSLVVSGGIEPVFSG